MTITISAHTLIIYYLCGLLGGFLMWAEETFLWAPNQQKERMWQISTINVVIYLIMGLLGPWMLVLGVLAVLMSEGWRRVPWYRKLTGQPP